MRIIYIMLNLVFEHTVTHREFSDHEEFQELNEISLFRVQGGKKAFGRWTKAAHRTA
jgi:hypothetical protein